MFDETNTGKWKEYREFLEQNLTTEEFDNAKESVLTAFYTPKIIIDYMYKGLEKLGFENGNILDIILQKLIQNRGIIKRCPLAVLKIKMFARGTGLLLCKKLLAAVMAVRSICMFVLCL